MPAEVLDGTCLELHVTWLRTLHVEVENNNVPLEITRHLEDVIERCRCCSLHTLLQRSGSSFLHAVHFRCLLNSPESDILAVERLDGCSILLPFLGLLPFSVGFGDNDCTIHAELVVRIID